MRDSRFEGGWNGGFRIGVSYGSEYLECRHVHRVYVEMCGTLREVEVLLCPRGGFRHICMMILNRVES